MTMAIALVRGYAALAESPVDGLFEPGEVAARGHVVGPGAGAAALVCIVCGNVVAALSGGAVALQAGRAVIGTLQEVGASCTVHFMATSTFGDAAAMEREAEAAEAENDGRYSDDDKAKFGYLHLFLHINDSGNPAVLKTGPVGFVSPPCDGFTINGGWSCRCYTGTPVSYAALKCCYLLTALIAFFVRYGLSPPLLSTTLVVQPFEKK